MNIPFISTKKKENTSKKKKSLLREWLDAAVFAIVAATIIRTFFIEAYTIPSPSMEKSLLVNDYLFVSKMHYGARLPMTPLAIPFIHNSMPFVGGKSYSTAVKWPYKRLWGFSEIQRFDDVVFNFPNGDTVYLPDPSQDFYSYARQLGRQNIPDDQIATHPVDKKENYIKRCVAIAGDTLHLKQGVLHINGETIPDFKYQLQSYRVVTNSIPFNTDMLEEIGIDPETDGKLTTPNVYFFYLTKTQANLLKTTFSNVLEVVPLYEQPDMISPYTGMTYPYDSTHFKWNVDNYGPIYIPKKGVTVMIDSSNIALYRRVIKNYEGHDLVEKNNKIFIDGKEAKSYTFSMNYYWLMGDNRHQSSDSRFWGFVPEDHVVGKAWFIWMSYGKHGIRWNRLFRSVKALEK
ncbi:MAG: signal peptidase I [Chitinophagaceae bacterium]